MHPKKALCLYLNTLQMPPLITHPTWIFLVMLCVILLTPIILRRLRIPHIIGLIVAGAVLGEHGLNVLARDTSIELFGQVGIYYIMFLAGLEMDMGSFRRHGSTGAVFGALTFLIPFALGMLSARYVLQMSVASSLLVPDKAAPSAPPPNRMRNADRGYTAHGCRLFRVPRGPAAEWY